MESVTRFTVDHDFFAFLVDTTVWILVDCQLLQYFKYMPAILITVLLEILNILRDDTVPGRQNAEQLLQETAEGCYSAG